MLVHAGFGIQVIDPAEAEETLRLVRELPDLFDEDLAQAEAVEERAAQAEPSLDDGGAA